MHRCSSPADTRPTRVPTICLPLTRFGRGASAHNVTGISLDPPTPPISGPSKGQSSRCASCVHGHHSDTRGAPNSRSGRHNLSSRGTIDADDLENPFAKGMFRWVAEGRYTSGPRSGQPAVLKWFKSGSVFSEDFFKYDIKAVDKALEGGLREDEKILVEPFIDDYQKFNSNTGWTNDDDGWAEVMQALSHFSYHISGGFYVLCDLQGGIYAREVVLSDPVILSRTRQFGVTDLGPDGISRTGPGRRILFGTSSPSAVVACCDATCRLALGLVFILRLSPAGTPYTKMRKRMITGDEAAAEVTKVAYPKYPSA
ncbi:hypothetical protein PWT90_00555 [Aphanocladium album]|nr:hypothetical protein PWT90_00555 [Aphanocladium album]